MYPQSSANHYHLSDERQRQCEIIAASRLPGCVIELTSSQVDYTLPTSQVPIKELTFSTLARLLKERFGLRFKAPESESLLHLQRKGLWQGEDDVQTLGEILQKLESPVLIFENGRLRLGPSTALIEAVRIDEESVLVRLRQGSTEIGESLVQEIIEIVWQSAEAPRSWFDIEPHLQVVTFGTSTKVKLDAPFEYILSEHFRTFVSSEVVAGKTYAASMGGHVPNNQAKERVYSFALDEIAFWINSFDKNSGRSDRCKVRIGVAARSELNTGTVQVSTMMNTPSHLKFVEHMCQVLRNAQS